jgi:hypothetical protein
VAHATCNVSCGHAAVANGLGSRAASGGLASWRVTLVRATPAARGPNATAEDYRPASDSRAADWRFDVTGLH